MSHLLSWVYPRRWRSACGAGWLYRLPRASPLPCEADDHRPAVGAYSQGIEAFPTLTCVQRIRLATESQEMSSDW